MGMRKCSQCAKTGHNSRTCRSLENIVGQSVKLFGVELGCFPTSDDVVSSSSTSPELLLPPSYENSDNLKNGNFSNNGITLGHRRKGVAWSEEEHKLFLMGLKKLGKGDWRGISKNFVTTRTSAQVASHAQKYFLRHSNNAKKNMLERNESPEEKPISFCRLIKKYHGIQNSSPSLELSLADAP